MPIARHRGLVAIVSLGVVMLSPGAALAKHHAAPTPAFPVDPVAKQAYVDDGLGEPAARFLAMTDVTVEPVSDLSAAVVADFPTGNTLRMVVTAHPGQTGDPASIAVGSFPVAEGYGLVVSYFVPYAGMPADVEQHFRDATAIAWTGLADVPLDIAQGNPGNGIDGVRVVAVAVAGKVGSDAVKSFLKSEVKTDPGAARLDFLSKSKKTYDLLKALADQYQEFLDFKRRLDAAERCVKDPTNPVTRKAYKEDPAQRQAILDQIEATRSELVDNAIATLLGTAAKTVSVKEAPWLSYITGPATAWARATLKDVNERLVAELERAIVPCSAYRFDFSGTRTVHTGGFDIPATWHYEGLKCPGLDWAVWEHYSGAYGEGVDTKEAHPYLFRFTDDGDVASIHLDGLGKPLKGDVTWAGTKLRLFPNGNAPTEVRGTMVIGHEPFPIQEPIEKLGPEDPSCGIKIQ